MKYRTGCASALPGRAFPGAQLLRPARAEQFRQVWPSGPDLLADALERAFNDGVSLHVVLAGWRRQYIIGRLERAGIPYTYFELPTQEVLNELYQTLDLYPVTARYEGGPQSLIECGLLGIRCVSRPVGIASDVLPLEAIGDKVELCTPAVPNVEALKLPAGYAPFRKLIEEV